MKKIIKIILISLVIYIFFFCRNGNSCFKINSDGNKIFNIIPILSGFFRPLKKLYLTFINDGLFKSIKYFNVESYNLANPFAVFIFVFGIFKIIEQNKIFN